MEKKKKNNSSFYFSSLALGWALKYISFILSSVTWVYIAVADILSWPSISWTDSKSQPSFNKWVAKECLIIWGDIFLSMEVFFISLVNISSIPLLVILLPKWFKNT